MPFHMLFPHSNRFLLAPGAIHLASFRILLISSYLDIISFVLFQLAQGLIDRCAAGVLCGFHFRIRGITDLIAFRAGYFVDIDFYLFPGNIGKLFDGRLSYADFLPFCVEGHVFCNRLVEIPFPSIFGICIPSFKGIFASFGAAWLLYRFSGNNLFG